MPWPPAENLTLSEEDAALYPPASVPHMRPKHVPRVPIGKVPPFSTSPVPVYNRLSLSELEASSSPWNSRSQTPGGTPPAEGDVSVVVRTPQSDGAVSLCRGVDADVAASPAITLQHSRPLSPGGADVAVDVSPGCHVSLTVGPSNGCVPLLEPLLSEGPQPSRKLGIIQRCFLRLQRWWRWICDFWRRALA